VSEILCAGPGAFGFLALARSRRRSARHSDTGAVLDREGLKLSQANGRRDRHFYTVIKTLFSLEPNARTVAILGDENHAGGFDSLTYRLDCLGRNRNIAIAFGALDRREGKPRRGCNIGLRQSRQVATGANLSGTFQSWLDP
jgi:hypothetical protein